MDNIKTIVNNVTEVFITLHSLSWPAFGRPIEYGVFGDVAGNITSLVATL